jgi:uncharacterized repeat protein (TIGR01451 family)
VNKVGRGRFEKSVSQVSVSQVAAFALALALLVAGCMLLGWSSHLRKAAQANSYLPPLQGPTTSSVLASNAKSSPALSSSGRLSLATLPLPPRIAAEKAHALLSGLPLIFEPNQGQANLDPSDARARFIAQGSGYSLVFGSQGAILNLHSPASANQPLQMKLAGANPNATLTGADRLPGTSSYLLGNDSSKWRQDIPQFARVRYENIYSGINLVFYGNQGHLEYDFQVAPGADPAQAELEFSGAKGLELNQGSLVVKTGAGDLRFQAPHIYQQIDGGERAVDGRFILRGGNRAGFAIGNYDRSRELVIDPILFFSTYFGGTGNELSTYIAVDGSGNVYLTGSTTSPTLPAGFSGVPPFQPALAGPQNLYIAKINPILNPVTLEYVTYLGGNGLDTPVGIAVDGAGDVYVAGTTTSTNFPTTGTAYQSVPNNAVAGTQHVFVSELNPTLTPNTAQLEYSTYLSGNGNDVASGMTIDGSGDAYVTGTTTSVETFPSTEQFPATNAPNPLPFESVSPAPGQPEFFVTKVDTFNASVGSIPYSTYFGGANLAGGASESPLDFGGGIAVDQNGNMYFDGTTNYTYTNGSIGDFPILNPFQPCLDQPATVQLGTLPVCTISSTQTATDGFAAKINPNLAQGSQLQWSTYLGGSQTDSATGIGVDPQGAAHVYIVGTTNSPDVTSLITTTFSSFQQCLNTPVNPASGTACPTAPSGAPTDAFVAQLTNPTSSSTTGTTNMSLNYFTYLGGSGNEAGLAITVDNSNGALVTGWTQSSGASGSATAFPVFPTPNIQGTLTGSEDAFVARMNTVAQLPGQPTRNGSWATYFGGTNTSGAQPATTLGTGIALDVNQDTYFAGTTNAVDLQVTGMQELVSGTSTFVNTNAGGNDAFATELETIPTLTITGVLTLGTNQIYISAGTPAQFTYTITNTGPDLASNVTFTDDMSQAITNVALTNIQANANSGTCSTTTTANSISCIIPSLQSGSTDTVTVTATPTATITGGQENFNGGTVQVVGPHNNVLASTQVTGQMSDFSIAVAPPDVSIAAAGDTAEYTIQLTPDPVYTSAISLSCTNTPPGAACSFAPTTSVTLLGPGAGAVRLNLTTTPRPINVGSIQSFSRRVYAIWFGIPALAVLGVGVGGRRRVSKRGFWKVIGGLLMVYALVVLLVPLPACSGTSTRPPTGGTPSGNFFVTVTGGAGSDTKSQTVELSVP